MPHSLIFHHKAFIAIGSNLENPIKQCSQAIKYIHQLKDSLVEKISSLYASEPLVPQNQNPSMVPEYLNAVVGIKTNLNPDTLLNELIKIETLMGRTRHTRWESRIIDLDLLFFDDLILKSEKLVLPHPEITRRRFVLEPLFEICPDWIHPITLEPVSDLLQKAPLLKIQRLPSIQNSAL